MPDCDTQHCEDALHKRNIGRWRKSRMNHRWSAGETAVISSTNWGGVVPKQPAAHTSSTIQASRRQMTQLASSNATNAEGFMSVLHAQAGHVSRQR
jgi:hypothetical protein